MGFSFTPFLGLDHEHSPNPLLQERREQACLHVAWHVFYQWQGGGHGPISPVQGAIGLTTSEGPSSDLELSA